MMKLAAYLPASLFAFHAIAAAAPVVEVAGIRDPELKAYRTMVKGLDAFDLERPRAPKAGLRFLLRPAAPGETLDGLTLTISGDTVRLPVELAADGGFVLPRSAAALADRAELVLNKKRNSFRWRPDVRSPGVPANARRLGDLRLQCAVQWAIDREALTPQARAALEANGGPCHSPLAHTGFEAPQPLRAAWLREGTRREALPVNRQHTRRFTPPLADGGWSDDAVVEFDYGT
ncbi:hypothetical protein [Pseudoduganella armeniaca]|uniref:Uncharacterized protein n=1 Tax=Pseudoduganella armeniaca TaxID=2072590 RepID=A0A2R4C8Q1_9BURK|nr:hypothetical protein [Pseudoduganella armeniaca]AVR95922.1 hypothetical protein C9I28_09390 [Pseudoduganella armeniaca]